MPCCFDDPDITKPSDSVRLLITKVWLTGSPSPPQRLGVAVVRSPVNRPDQAAGLPTPPDGPVGVPVLGGPMTPANGAPDARIASARNAIPLRPSWLHGNATRPSTCTG